MKHWIIRLFCRHVAGDFVRNIYGDEINHCGGKRSMYRCSKCGEFMLMSELRP